MGVFVLSQKRELRLIHYISVRTAQGFSARSPRNRFQIFFNILQGMTRHRFCALDKDCHPPVCAGGTAQRGPERTGAAVACGSVAVEVGGSPTAGLFGESGFVGKMNPAARKYLGLAPLLQPGGAEGFGSMSASESNFRTQEIAAANEMSRGRWHIRHLRKCRIKK